MDLILILTVKNDDDPQWPGTSTVVPSDFPLSGDFAGYRRFAGTFLNLRGSCEIVFIKVFKNKNKQVSINLARYR